MAKYSVVIAVVALCGASTGCVTRSGGTLFSELRNDHEPGTATPAWLRAREQRSHAAPTATARSGDACRVGFDCLSGVCEHAVCLDLGGDERTAPSPMLSSIR